MNSNRFFVAASAAILSNEVANAQPGLSFPLDPYNQHYPQSQFYSGYNSWFNPTQDFLVPTKQYIPAATHPIFAECKGKYIREDTGAVVDQNIQIVQFEGKAPLINYNMIFDGSVASQNSQHYLILNEFGDISTDQEICDRTGPEYNPYSQQDYYGNTAPNQDPNYGRLPSFTTTGTQLTDHVPQQFLQNLEGRYSILGRSITVYNDQGKTMFCCRISVAKTPDGYEPEYEDAPYHHHELHQYSPPPVKHVHVQQHEPSSYYGGHDQAHLNVNLSQGAHDQVGYGRNVDSHHDQGPHQDDHHYEPVVSHLDLQYKNHGRGYGHHGQEHGHHRQQSHGYGSSHHGHGHGHQNHGQGHSQSHGLGHGHGHQSHSLKHGSGHGLGHGHGHQSHGLEHGSGHGQSHGHGHDDHGHSQSYGHGNDHYELPVASHGQSDPLSALFL